MLRISRVTPHFKIALRAIFLRTRPKNCPIIPTFLPESLNQTTLEFCRVSVQLVLFDPTWVPCPKLSFSTQWVRRWCSLLLSKIMYLVIPQTWWARQSLCRLDCLVPSPRDKYSILDCPSSPRTSHWLNKHRKHVCLYSRRLTVVSSSFSIYPDEVSLRVSQHMYIYPHGTARIDIFLSESLIPLIPVFRVKCCPSSTHSIKNFRKKEATRLYLLEKNHADLWTTK